MLYDRGFTLKIFLSRPAFDQNAAGLIRAAGAAGNPGLVRVYDTMVKRTKPAIQPVGVS